MNPIKILLVEDNDGDIRLTQEAFKESKLKCKIDVTKDGAAAMDYLNQVGDYKDKKTPDLIILDLNLPKKDGREVLNEIKADNQLKKIPVVILTTSHDEEDVCRSYGLHANAYVTKPLDFGKFMDVVKKIGDFWFTVVKLPKKKKN